VEKKYIIGNVLGKGGFGTVYEGEDKITGAKVAIKIQKAKEKYILMELDILERISKDCHEYFLCIYDVIKEKDGDIQIIIMELVDGVDMTAIIQDKEFTKPERDRIMNLLEISIEKLHDLGVAHKDIKPDNIMVTKDGRVKLVDYGLSCMDMSCSWGGTPKYMHPYMIKHKGDLPREMWMSSDWYSLYVIGKKVGMGFKFLKRIQDKYESLEKINDQEAELRSFMGLSDSESESESASVESEESEGSDLDEKSVVKPSSKRLEKINDQEYVRNLQQQVDLLELDSEMMELMKSME
jgi:serine/threonine protein kinase